MAFFFYEAEEKPLRKQTYSLTPDDLLRYPLWEFCSDEEDAEGQDEATVKPSLDSEVPGYSPGAYVVVADVSFNNGRKAIGYLYSGKPDDIGCIQPNVFLETSQVNLWLGALKFNSNWREYVSDALERIGAAADLLFPMSFETRAKVNGGLLKVVIDGFKACGENERSITLK